MSRVGSLRRLNLIEEEAFPPGDTEVAIDVKAIGLNFADVFTILGLYRAAPRRNCVPGIEFSGVVVAVGAEVKDIRVNDRVMGSIRFGAYTTHLTIDHRYVIRIPEGWSFEEGASFIVQSLTAYYALVSLGNIQKGQTVLIHSAAGGVGLYANRIAKRYSAFTIGTVGNASKIPLLKREGCDRIIVRSAEFKRELLAALGGRSLDLVLDAVGGRTQKVSFDALGATGRLVAYGLSEFASHLATPNYLRLAWKYLGIPRYHTLRLIEFNKSVLGFNLIWLYDRVELWRSLLATIGGLGLERPHVGSVYPFPELKDAIRLLQSGKTTGKVVVSV
jgi:alcohol dehydrogenase